MITVTLPTNLRPEVSRVFKFAATNDPQRKHLKQRAEKGKGGCKQSRPICGQKCKANRGKIQFKKGQGERETANRRPNQSAARNTCVKESRQPKRSRRKDNKRGEIDRPNQSAAGPVKRGRGDEKMRRNGRERNRLKYSKDRDGP